MLLVLITLIALTFGITTYHVEKRRHAIELLESNFAHIEYGNDFVGNWWTRGLFGEERFRAVNIVILLGVSSESISVDDLISELTDLREVKSLRLHQATDIGLHRLTGLSNLQQLVVDDFNGRKLTNEGFSKLKLLRSLQFLWLENIAIDDQVLDYIAESPQLNRLHIKQTFISEEGVANLQRRLPTTRIVYSKRILSPGLWP